MPDLLFCTIFLVFFFFLEFFYFRIASDNKIIDKPNERSSHTHITIRGGGIIFPVSVICGFILNKFQYPFFVSGLLLLSVISFLDDVKDIHSRIRFLFQSLAIVFLFVQFQFTLDWYWYLLIFIIITGTINAYNFMDGINGMTGAYSLAIIGTLWYMNRFILPFTSGSLLVLVLLSVLVFNFFNFRIKARCFAGDVGSVSIAFIIAFLLMSLINETSNFLFISLLLVYGLDSVTTIIFRLIRKENIFEAHRSHFYQFLANEKGWPHLVVSGIYVGVQLLINVFILSRANNVSTKGSVISLVILVIVSGIVFVGIRFCMEGKRKLLGIME